MEIRGLFSRPKRRVQRHAGMPIEKARGSINHCFESPRGRAELGDEYTSIRTSMETLELLMSSLTTGEEKISAHGRGNELRVAGKNGHCGG